MQIMVEKGKVPRLTGFSKAVLPPHKSIPPHAHAVMDEIFYIEAGECIFHLDGEPLKVSAGTSIHAAAGQVHAIDNVSDKELVLLYFGILLEDQW
jgi:quercetin dioxygenase-like cupin family protein